METISAQNLLKCLQDKDNYKGTLVYLQEVNKFNEKVYDYVNVALEGTLLQKHKNYMAKLLALRLFKEIILTGNFTLIDGLNEKIEDEIFKVAQYNKKCKEINRGANYFVEMENLKKDTDVQKVGSSYVLLASEIIVALAKWYPVDEEGEETRFYQVWQQMQAAGVPLPMNNQLNFFKKDDEEKFKKNYAKWIKWYVQNVKQEDNEETTKQLTATDPSKRAIEKEEKAKNTEDKKQKEEIFVKKESVPEIKVLDVKPEQQKIESTVQKDLESSKQMASYKTKSQAKEKQYISRVKQLEQALQKMQTEAQKFKQRSEDKLQTIFKQKEDTQAVLKKTQQNLQESQLQKINMREALESNSQKLLQLSCLNAELQQRITHLQIQRQAAKESAKDPPYNPVPLEPECYNIKLSPPREFDDLEQQNQILTSALENAEEQFRQMKKVHEEEISQIREQKMLIASTLSQAIKELEEYKSKKSLQQELIQNIIRQDSLVVEDQPRIHYRAQPLENTVNETQAFRKDIIKNCSVSEYLRATSKMVVAENIQPQIEPPRRSLKKTESQNRLRSNKESQLFCNTGFNFESKASTNKLNKTTNNFIRKIDLESNSNVVTYYPYLSDYFQPIPQGSPSFKRFCLNLDTQKGIFFENQIIKAHLEKQTQFLFVLTIFNKSQAELKIKVLSGHYSFLIQGQKSKKIQGNTSGDFLIKTQKLDLNLRYPIISVMIGNQRLSLSNSVPNERTIHIPLPLTLLDFCSIYPEKDKEWISDTKIGKFSSNQVTVSRCNSSLNLCFPSFKITYSRNQTIASAGLELNGMQDAKVYVQIQQNSEELTVGIWFRNDSPNGISFGKVIMQVLLFLIQK